MDATAYILLFAIILFLVVIVFLLLNPTFEIMPYPVMPRHHSRHPVMPQPQFGPYWTHGGQTNSGLLY